MTRSNNSLNTLIGLLTLLCAIVTCVFFLAPLKTLPDDVKAMQLDMRGLQQTQAVQAEVLKTMAEVSKETGALRRDFDKNRAEYAAQQTVQESRITSVQIRVGRLERTALKDADESQSQAQ